MKDNSHYFHFLHRRYIKYKLSFAKRIMKIIFFWEFILLKDLWWKWETLNDFFSTVRKIWWILMAVKSHYFLSKVSGRHYCANIGNFWIFFALLCLSLILIMNFISCTGEDLCLLNENITLMVKFMTLFNLKLTSS